MHIPFCRQACHYCNFHFTTSLRYKPELVDALVREAELRAPYLEGAPVETIYFGGGTPSLLSERELDTILESLRRHYPITADAEITLEANPDDIDPARLAAWKRSGVNRLSIGVQSFFEEELRWMNRAHSAAHARSCIEQSLAAGFSNMTIDLIYGSPLLSDEGWKTNVDIATGYGIPHLSCYALTVEERTPLHKQIARSEKTDVDNDKQARQFLLLMQWLKERGYEHYEVSNFAKPGYRSQHNSAYWKGIPYLGLGPSAHSYNGRERSWNIANNNTYIRALSEGSLPAEAETLTRNQRLNEYLMISLRTLEGIDLARVQEQATAGETSGIEKQLNVFLREGLVKKTGSGFALTDEGMLRADGLAAELFT
ncbi:radical SAM family heme chaperone HemW [Flaviaesturariibacter flavus]|uniref:radical SAM family heme chaperone HemW n=1 Tax=Flaviaesturariibacter flavus TaxID=2502780 RepID=UPI001FB1B5E7|nr:radical SAM family heme chaperone HemW [Flaviaesturariibacter flavus]